MCQEIRYPDIMEWVRLNSKALRRQLKSVDSFERDDFGLVLVLATFTSPAFTDLQFLNETDMISPVVMGCKPESNGSLKWLRGYPSDSSSNFDGEIHVNERSGVISNFYPVDDKVAGDWTMFVNGYSIQKASLFRRLVETANDFVRSEEAKKAAQWKKDVIVRKISEI
jgi:hypothetical protein